MIKLENTYHFKLSANKVLGTDGVHTILDIFIGVIHSAYTNEKRRTCTTIIYIRTQISFVKVLKTFAIQNDIICDIIIL